MHYRSVSAVKLFVGICIVFIPAVLMAQGNIKWAKNGNGYYRIEQGEIVLYTLPQNTKTVVVSAGQLTPGGKPAPLAVRNFSFSDNEKKVLIYTNSKKVWRLQTRGDYWVFDSNIGALQQIGKNRPASSCM